MKLKEQVFWWLDFIDKNPCPFLQVFNHRVLTILVAEIILKFSIYFCIGFKIISIEPDFLCHHVYKFLTFPWSVNLYPMLDWHPICSPELWKNVKVDLDCLVFRYLQAMTVKIFVTFPLFLAVFAFENLLSFCLEKLLNFDIAISFLHMFISLDDVFTIIFDLFLHLDKKIFQKIKGYFLVNFVFILHYWLDFTHLLCYINSVNILSTSCIYLSDVVN